MVIIHLVVGKKDSQKNEQTNSQSEKLKRIMTKIRMRIKSITLKMALKVFMSRAIRTQGDKIDELIKFIKDSKLNTMVIDVKDDEGNITMKLNTGNKQVDKNTLDIVDGKKLLKNCIITIFIQLLVSLHLRILN